MKIVTTHSSEETEVFRNLRKQLPDQLKQGFFYAEGEQVFARLLESQLEIVSVLITPKFFELHRKELEIRSCSVVVAEKSFMESITAQKLNQGIVAFARISSPFELSSLASLSSFCLVALDGLDHAVNIGTIFRNCAVFGVDAVVTTSIHPYSGRVIRASSGGVFQVPHLVSTNLCDSLKFLKDLGTTLIAADPSSQILVSEKKFPQKICLILGNEHQGISSEISTMAPERIAIPMSGKMDSLNVAAASAIFLYEIRRQRM